MAATMAASNVEPAELLASIGQAIIATDLDGVVLYWNQAAQELYGWSAAEATGRNITTLTVPEVAQDVAADIIAALRDGVPWSGGFPVRRKDGRRFPALVTDAGIYRRGQLVGIVGVSTNLGTALRPLLERAADAAIVLTADAIVTYASPAVGQLFGWQDDALIGSSIVPLIHPDDRPVLGRFLEQLLTEPGAHPPVELRVRHEHDWVGAEAAFTNLLDDPVVRGVVCNLRPSVLPVALQEAHTRIEQLEHALQSRLIIELAKGFLAGRDGVTPDRAFERIRAFARSHHLTVQEVSTWVIAGDLLSEPE